MTQIGSSGRSTSGSTADTPSDLSLDKAHLVSFLPRSSLQRPLFYHCPLPDLNKFLFKRLILRHINPLFNTQILIEMFEKFLFKRYSTYTRSSSIHFPPGYMVTLSTESEGEVAPGSKWSYSLTGR